MNVFANVSGMVNFEIIAFKGIFDSKNWQKAKKITKPQKAKSTHKNTIHFKDIKYSHQKNAFMGFRQLWTF